MNKKLIIPITGIFIVGVGLLISKLFFEQPFKYAGTVEVTRIDLPARVSTTIESIFVQEGDAIRKDQVISVLSCEDVLLQQQLATENYQRAVNLKRTGSISKESFDLLQNKKQDADIRKSWCEIKSPVNGVVLTRFLEPSEWVNPGTKLFTVADVSDLWAYFYVPQIVMSQLKVGAGVMGEVPELNRQFPGKIIKINEEAEFTPKNVQTQSERTRLIFGIKVQFRSHDLVLKPGMTIESTLSPGK